MSRVKENDELFDKVNEMLIKSDVYASRLEAAGVRDALNLYIRLDISRSLAVIADVLQAGKRTE